MIIRLKKESWTLPWRITTCSQIQVDNKSSFELRSSLAPGTRASVHPDLWHYVASLARSELSHISADHYYMIYIPFLLSMTGCPYECSGHGECDASMVCTCNAGWRGAGCDIPECRNNCNHPNGECVNGMCRCDNQHRGEKNNELTFFSLIFFHENMICICILYRWVSARKT